jgi:hypothetical protein
MDAITDRFGVTCAIIRTPWGDRVTIYHGHRGSELVARAVLRVDKGCINDVLIYRQADRRRGIASALYRLIKAKLGRQLVPSRIRSKAGRKFWASRC